MAKALELKLGVSLGGPTAQRQCWVSKCPKCQISKASVSQTFTYDFLAFVPPLFTFLPNVALLSLQFIDTGRSESHPSLSLLGFPHCQRCFQEVIPKSSQPLFNHFSNHCSLWNPLKSPCSICSCHRFCNHFSSEKHHVPFVPLHRHVQTWTMVWSSVHQFFPFQSTMFQCYQPVFLWNHRMFHLSPCFPKSKPQMPWLFEPKPLLQTVQGVQGTAWKPPGRRATASKSTSRGSLLSQAMSSLRTWPGGLQVWPPGDSHMANHLPEIEPIFIYFWNIFGLYKWTIYWMKLKSWISKILVAGLGSKQWFKHIFNMKIWFWAVDLPCFTCQSMWRSQQKQKSTVLGWFITPRLGRIQSRKMIQHWSYQETYLILINTGDDVYRKIWAIFFGGTSSKKNHEFEMIWDFMFFSAYLISMLMRF